MTSPISPSALHPMFMAPPVLLDLVQRGETISLNAHETLFREGDPVQHLYCVAEGTMVLSRYSISGERQIMAFFFPGDFLGLTIETVSRCFTKLKETGCIALPTTDRVTLIDVKALRAAADVI
ncbi:MAG: cyclic nucleotide-binding domain-containing protein, partial [Rhodospirillaceae bacterium]|nr:cyclic nucleotide-binding domain-containing protein [Rhodospirillaceae bacterium]